MANMELKNECMESIKRRKEHMKNMKRNKIQKVWKEGKKV